MSESKRWGDRPFYRTLRAQKRSVRKAVFDAVAMFPYFNPTEFPLMARMKDEL